MNFKTLSILLLLIFVVFLGSWCIQKKKEYFEDCASKYDESDIETQRPELIKALDCDENGNNCQNTDICSLNDIDMVKDCITDNNNSDFCQRFATEAECPSCYNCVWDGEICKREIIPELSSEPAPEPDSGDKCFNRTISNCTEDPDCIVDNYKCTPYKRLGENRCLTHNTLGYCQGFGCMLKTNSANCPNDFCGSGESCASYENKMRKWAMDGSDRTPGDKKCDPSNYPKSCRLGDMSKNVGLLDKSSYMALCNGSGYQKYNCKLRTKYKECVDLQCIERGLCPNVDTDGNISCGNCISGKNIIDNQEMTKSEQYCKKPPSSGGFGCPGKEFSDPPEEPLDPDTNNGMVCNYRPK